MKQESRPGCVSTLVFDTLLGAVPFGIPVTQHLLKRRVVENIDSSLDDRYTGKDIIKNYLIDIGRIITAAIIGNTWGPEAGVAAYLGLGTIEAVAVAHFYITTLDNRR